MSTKQPKGKYFTNKELSCPCCGANNVAPEFIERLDILRERCGFPLVVNSAYRCLKHNFDVGGEDNSAHLAGVAVDINVRGAQAYILLSHALDLGFLGVGIKQFGASRFIHLDDAPDMTGRPRPWVWSYQR